MPFNGTGTGIENADDIFRVHVDGVQCFSATNFDYRNRNDIHIQAILYYVHRGGGIAPNWVSSRDTYIDVRNIVMRDLEV